MDDGVAEVHIALALVGQRLHRINHNARQPCGVEHALVEIELPGSVLLCQQLALQLVCQARDSPRERPQFLVEKCSQALQFFRRRQVLGCNFLVELARIDIVSEGCRVIQDREVRPPGLIGVGGFVAVGIHVELICVGKIRRVVELAFFALRRLLFAGALAALATFALILIRLLATVRLVVLITGFVLLVAFCHFLGQLEHVQHVAHHASELLLVFGERIEPVERVSGALFDPRPPDVDDRLGVFGWAAGR